MTGPTVADELARWILTEAGGVVHLVAGAQIDPLVVACADAGVRLVPMATEFGAAAAAAARARTTGSLAVVPTIGGPGLANAAPGLTSARSGAGAVVAISGDVPRALAGAGGFQDGRHDGEVGRRALGAGVRVRRAEQLRAALTTVEGRAARQAGTHLVVPWDVQQRPMIGTEREPGPGARPVVGPASAPDHDLGTVVVLATPCGPRGVAALEQFVERGGVVLATVDAAGVLEAAHVHGVVDPGGRCQHAPVLVDARTAQVVVVGGVLDERTLGRAPADIRASARLLHVAPHVDGPCTDDEQVCTPADLETWLAEHLHDVKAVAHDRSRVEPGEVDRVVTAARRSVGTDAHVVVDAGRARSAVARTAAGRTTGRVLSATTDGSMGWSLGAAVGAAGSASDRTVLVVLGDGSCLVALGELAVIGDSAHDIRVLLLVNGGYGSVRARLPAAARGVTDLGDHVDWVGLGRSLGLRTTAASTPDEVETALGERGPSMVVVATPTTPPRATMVTTWRGAQP